MQRRTPVLAGAAVAALAAASFLTAAPAAAVQVVPPVTFTADTANWLVPAGVYSIDVTAVGGAGGAGGDFLNSGLYGGSGGAGATVTSTIFVTPGETIDITIGLAGDDGGAVFAFGAGEQGMAWVVTAPTAAWVRTVAVVAADRPRCRSTATSAPW